MNIPDYTENYDVQMQAKRYGMRVVDGESTLRYLHMNEVDFGAPYCVNKSFEHSDNTICPCRDMRERQECICGLYVKED